MPPSAIDTMQAGPAVAPSRVRPAPRVRAERPRHWARLVRLLTDPREARAHLHRLDLGGTHRTWG